VNPPGPPPASRRLDLALFATLFTAHAYFFQGGGWNQNGRIAQARALVEGGTFAIDDYLVYRVRPVEGERRLARRVPPGGPWEKIANRAATADVSFGGGLYYPNKPPGASLAAALVYLPIFAIERALGVDLDHHRPLLLNAYLMTVGTVGLAGALVGVLFLRSSRAFHPQAPPWTHAAAALTLGLGTLMLPFSTMLFDHVLTAFWLLLACVLVVTGDPTSKARGMAAGAAAAAAILTNYSAALPLLALGGYLVAGGRARHAPWAVLGALPPLVLLALFHWSAFGTVWTIPNLQQYGMFVDEGRFLGLFALPSPEALWKLLVSPYRGLFFTSPVLVLSLFGLVLMARRDRGREAALIVAVFGGLWLMNGAFNGWEGGFTIGPRYLIPAIPFLCLALVPAFQGYPRLTTTVAAISMALMVLVTAVDPQTSPRIRNPLVQYVWALWRDGRVVFRGIDIRGHVSANPIGVYEGWYYTFYGPGSPEAENNSFNLGELVWPARRVSVLPLAVLVAGGVALTLRESRRLRPPAVTEPSDPSAKIDRSASP
jgi:hypothetical protein